MAENVWAWKKLFTWKCKTCCSKKIFPRNFQEEKKWLTKCIKKWDKQKQCNLTNNRTDRLFRWCSAFARNLTRRQHIYLIITCLFIGLLNFVHIIAYNGFLLPHLPRSEKKERKKERKNSIEIMIFVFLLLVILLLPVILLFLLLLLLEWYF